MLAGRRASGNSDHMRKISISQVKANNFQHATILFILSVNAHFE